ncbi:FAD binding domain-containing protein [Lophiotrema nucula]|uniref:FAD binding domain-containing protein n=1 Tax=Lophiotrema nucula TaxID=690887 RepID=A0A6A5ZNB8_9PLEO|nr:FAD binding domain-containing protein [Lophiotrema nucula]
MAEKPQTTDVFICGGGPVGLLLAYSLARQGVQSLVVERYQRELQEKHGRATSLYPRSLELLEREDLFDQLAQVGFFARNSITYKDGQVVPDRGWQILWKHFKESFHSYVLNIRQKYSEDIFRASYEALGYRVQFGWELSSYEIDTKLEDGHNVTARIKSLETGEEKVVRCKYLVGADGGNSTVRQLSQIPMEGEKSGFKWIRIDGKFNTNMPYPDIGIGSIETETHGNVLWVRLDHDAHRIGYALSPKLYEKYGDNITEDQAKYEANEAMKPYTLEIERVDWMTCYGIGQRVAKQFLSDDFVLLAGDAGHTHSSGFAQGMNTGIHDATNVSWKLAGIVKGFYDPVVLQSFEDERRPTAQQLIEIDKSAAAAISGIVPAKYASVAAESSPDEAMRVIVEETAPFTAGLGIRYKDSIFNKPQQRKIMRAQGTRAPDVLLQKPGAQLRTRLYEINKSPGRWTVLVFAGSSALTKDALSQLRGDLALRSSFAQKYSPLLDFLTVVHGGAPSAWIALGGPAFGKMLLDPDGSAHDEYGIAVEAGGLVVLRPDTVIGFAADLKDVQEVDKYFAGFCKQSSL